MKIVKSILFLKSFDDEDALIEIYYFFN